MTLTSVASAAPVNTIRVNGKISDSAESWGLSPQKNDQSHKDWHRISGGALARRAGWPSLLEDPMATVLRYPNKIQYDSLPRQEGVSPLALVALVAGHEEEWMKEKEAWEGQGEM